nr:helix-turn-helix domain-containing protein [Acinetobacter tandoii]
MSFDATIWAWGVELNNSSQKVLLLNLAHRADNKHYKCFPSLRCIANDTGLDRKTIIKALDALEQKKLIMFTGKKVGNGVKTYQLVGFISDEQKNINNKNDDSIKKSVCSTKNTSTVIGMCSDPENGTATSSGNGTQNQSKNLSNESINKKNWLSLKKLHKEIVNIDADIDINVILTQSQFDREKCAFEDYNQNKKWSDGQKHYYFASWLLNAHRNKYSKVKKTEYTSSTSVKNQKHLSEKQVSSFAKKLSYHTEFANKYSGVGESRDEFITRISKELRDSDQLKKWGRYLTEVGFNDYLAG